MSLTDAIVQALEEAAPPPVNESTTCDRILYPLLQAIGYARRDILSRIADNNGQYPDYSLLPESAHGWFLEAKAWNIALQDVHAQQSLNYANQNGRRWVVLSNGQVWRLYDNDIRGLAADKRVAEARLEEIERAEVFLKAIGKESACSGGLERFALRSRLASLLHAQMEDANSDVIGALFIVLRIQSGLAGLSRNDIVSYFQDRSAVSKSPSPLEMPRTPPGRTDSEVGQGLPVLAEHSGEQVKSKKPETVHFPDGTQKPVNTWRELSAEVVIWMGNRGKFPALPFQGSQKGKNCFLNVTAHHKADKPMKRFVELAFPDRTLCLDTNRSAWDHLSRLCELCEAVGVNASQIRVSLRS
jgi:hypothetical protein